MQSIKYELEVISLEESLEQLEIKLLFHQLDIQIGRVDDMHDEILAFPCKITSSFLIDINYCRKIFFSSFDYAYFLRI